MLIMPVQLCHYRCEAWCSQIQEMLPIWSSTLNHPQMACAWEQDIVSVGWRKPITCNHMLTSSSSVYPPQCWRAGLTTLGSWSLLSRWPACLSSKTAWNDCWHSWARCSRSPCTAPHEGAREQHRPQSPYSMQKNCSGGSPLVSGCKENNNASARTWIVQHVLSDLTSAAISPIKKVLCGGIQCYSKPVSYMNIYMNIYGESAS